MTRKKRYSTISITTGSYQWYGHGTSLLDLYKQNQHIIINMVPLL